MSPVSNSPGSARCSVVVNEEIRALWLDPRVRLADEQRARYEQLLAEWASAMRVEGQIIEAA